MGIFGAENLNGWTDIHVSPSATPSAIPAKEFTSESESSESPIAAMAYSHD